MTNLFSSCFDLIMFCLLCILIKKHFPSALSDSGLWLWGPEAAAKPRRKHRSASFLWARGEFQLEKISKRNNEGAIESIVMSGCDQTAPVMQIRFFFPRFLCKRWTNIEHPLRLNGPQRRKTGVMPGMLYRRKKIASNMTLNRPKINTFTQTLLPKSEILQACRS